MTAAATTPPEKTPSIIGVYFYAIIMALFGGLLGFAYMLTFPAQAFSNQAQYEASLPDPEEGAVYSKPGDAYYFEGSVVANRIWERKRGQLEAEGPQTIRFAPNEINRWMSTKFRPAVKPSGEDTPDVLITPGVPNVAISVDGALYLSIPTEISAYGENGEYILFARCHIDTTGLIYDSVHISGAKVPLPNVIGRKILSAFAQAYESTDDYKIISSAFERAESVQIENGGLVISLR